MKAFQLLLLIPILAGCTKPNDGVTQQRLDSLESQVALLAESNADLSARVAVIDEFQMKKAVQFDMLSNDFSKLGLVTLRLATIVEDRQNRSLSEDSISTNRGPSHQGVTTAYRDGIPLDVYSSIVHQAQDDFPNDYNEQVFVIQQQVSAWKKLHQ